MPVIRLPSHDAPGVLDLYAEIPKGVSIPQAVRIANRVIWEVNIEDAETSPEQCDEMSCVEDSIKTRLAAQGFRFFELASTLNWDVYQEEQPAEADLLP